MAKPDKCISVAEARQLHDNWVATREPVITQMNNGKKDTREFVFSVAELEEFLDYVKDESDDQNIEKPGIRIYFGAYNENNKTEATVFLSATKGCNPDSEDNHAIDPMNTITGGFPPNDY